MDQKGKGLTIGLILLLVVFFVLSAAGLYLFQKERNNNILLQEELSDIKSRLVTTEKKLDKSNQTVTELEGRLTEAKAQISDINALLETEKSARQEAATKLDQLKSDLDAQKASRVSLEVKFNQAQEEAKQARAQLNDLESQKSELERKIGELEQKTSGVELGKIIVSPEQQNAAPAKESSPKNANPASSSKSSGIDGKVLVVNKEYNFAVINMGSKDGISLGSEFSVYNGDKYLGDIKVEKLRDSMAAAGFVSEGLKDKISEGDKVVKKGK